MTKNVLPVYLQYKTVELQVRTLQMYYIIHFSTFWCIYISIYFNSFIPTIDKKRYYTPPQISWILHRSEME